MNGEINERVTKIAAKYNEDKMKKCVNCGTETCCAPFCDYCGIYKRVKPMRELVDEWRRMSKQTRAIAVERGDIEEPKLSFKSVCDAYDQFLAQMEKSLEVYGDEAAQDRMKKGGAK